MDQPLRGMPHPFDKLHPRMYAAEFAGTTLLVFFGLSIVIAMWGHNAPFAGLPISADTRSLGTGKRCAKLVANCRRSNLHVSAGLPDFCVCGKQVDPAIHTSG